MNKSSIAMFIQCSQVLIDGLLCAQSTPLFRQSKWWKVHEAIAVHISIYRLKWGISYHLRINNCFAFSWWNESVDLFRMNDRFGKYGVNCFYSKWIHHWIVCLFFLCVRLHTEWCGKIELLSLKITYYPFPIHLTYACKYSHFCNILTDEHIKLQL